MIKANDLDGRAVVDLETAKKVGYVDEIYLDTDGAQIAAFQVSEGSKLAGGGQKVLIPISAVESIGPEAIMVRPIGATHREDGRQHGSIEGLPRLSHVTGHKVVTEGGKLVGAIDNVLIDGADGRIHGYTLKSAGWTGGLGDLFGTNNDRPDYVRGDANLRLGEDLLVVPEDAIVYGADRHDDEADHSHSRDRDRRSALDSLSTSRGTSGRATLRPPEPARVEYAEPIGHTEASFDSHPEPTFDRRTESIHVGDAAPFERTEPDFVPRTEPTHTAYAADSTDRVEHWDDVRSQYRTRWEQRTAGRGGLWEEHEPSYRYGWEMASQPTFRGRTWTTAEPELRRDWETRHHDRPWDRVADAIRDAWDGVAGRDESDVAGYSSTRHHDDRDELPAIEHLSGRTTPAAYDDSLIESERMATRSTAYPSEPLTESERLGTRRVAHEGTDSRRSLL